MNQFNASAWALEHKSFVGFLMSCLRWPGLLSIDHLGRDEDPPFTIKVMVVRAVWPGATAEEHGRRSHGPLGKGLAVVAVDRLHLELYQSPAKPR